MKTIHFTKMHGIGNDYVYIDCFKEIIDDPAEFSMLVSRQHFGIGSDGLILISPSEVADCKMNIFNADGSEAEMCGNGIRCVGKFLWDNGYVKEPKAQIETLCGVKTLELVISGGQCTGAVVDMGEPVLATKKIPAIFNEDQVIGKPLIVGGKSYEVTLVSMGNPHCVTFTEEVEGLNLPAIGPLFEKHHVFPARTNTEFVKVIDSTHLRMRVWERGSEETFACGTGACAATVASSLNGFTERDVEIRLNGGTLRIRWDEESNHVFLEGPAETSFAGEYYIY